jgi:membrane protease YdiL (CAAX protease family)
MDDPARSSKLIFLDKFFSVVGLVSSAVILTFASQVVSLLLLAFVLMGIGKITQFELENVIGESTNSLFVFFLVNSVIVLAGTYGLLKITSMNPKQIGLNKPKYSDVGSAVIAYFAYMIIFLGISFIASELIPGLDLEQEQQLGFQPTDNLPELVAIGISLVIIPPVIEEIVMRGYLYTGLRRKLKYWPAAIITSIVFAVLHLQFGSGAPLLWVAALDTFILSLFLVNLREKTGGLTAPIILHMIKNGLAFTLLFVLNK